MTSSWVSFSKSAEQQWKSSGLRGPVWSLWSPPSSGVYIRALLGLQSPWPMAPKLGVTGAHLPHNHFHGPFQALEYCVETLSPHQINHFGMSWTFSPYKPRWSSITAQPTVVSAARWCCWAQLKHNRPAWPLDRQRGAGGQEPTRDSMSPRLYTNTGQKSSGEGERLEEFPSSARRRDDREWAVKAEEGKWTVLQHSPGTKPQNSSSVRAN